MIYDFAEVCDDSDSEEAQPGPTEAAEEEPERTFDSRLGRRFSLEEEAERSETIKNLKTIVKYSKIGTAGVTAINLPAGLAAESLRKTCETVVSIIEGCESLILIINGNVEEKNMTKAVFNKLNFKVALLQEICSTIGAREHEFQEEEKRVTLYQALHQCSGIARTTDGNLQVVYKDLQKKRARWGNLKDWWKGRLSKMRESLEQSYLKMKECIDNLQLTLDATTSEAVQEVKEKLQQFELKLDEWQQVCIKMWEETHKLYEINMDLQHENGILKEEKGALQTENATLQGKLEVSKAEKEGLKREIQSQKEAMEKEMKDEKQTFQNKMAKLGLILLEKRPIMTVEDQSRLSMALILQNHEIIEEIMVKYANMSSEEQNYVISSLCRFGKDCVDYGKKVNWKRVGAEMLFDTPLAAPWYALLEFA